MRQSTDAPEHGAPVTAEPSSGRFFRVYAQAIRWTAPFVVAIVIGGAAAAVVLVPSLNATGGGAGLSEGISANSPAIRTQIQALQRFGFPLLAQNVVVQYRAGGLSVAAQAQTVSGAVRVDTERAPGLGQIAAAIPVTDQNGLFPSSSENGTTALTYLFYRPSVPTGRTYDLSREYAQRFLSGPGDGLVGVTGAFQAQAAQGQAISSSIDLVEYLSVALLLIITGVTLRSVVAPVLTLLTAGLAYELSQRLLSLATIHLGVSVPTELDPIIVVLLLGVVTDYCLFYLSALRRRLHSGQDPGGAARMAISEVTPLVLAAGITVAAGVSLIATARLALFASLAPGLAITVAVALVTVVTFVPASLVLLRSFALWPARGRTAAEFAPRAPFQRFLTRPVVAVPVLVVVLSGLGYLVHPLHSFGVGINLIGDLPSSNQVVQANRAASSGFAPGIVEPSELVVSGPTPVGRSQLDQLQSRIEADPGVAGVIGAANEPSFVPIDVFAASGGRTARFLVIFRDRPLSAAGIRDLSQVDAQLPRMMSASGMGGWSGAWAGDTALSRSIVGPSHSDLLQVGLLTMAVDLVVSLILLRSLLAPLILTLSSALVVAAALGVTLLMFPMSAEEYGLTFYMPFACEVLLLSFGADYNMFLAGEIWHQAARRRFRTAVARGGAHAASAINVAGLTLASSFAVLAVVPLRAFREIAVCMTAGLLIDTFVVRFVLVPALLSLVGPVVMWPGKRERNGRVPSPGGADRSMRQESEEDLR